jgi:MHS family proline/betaine transporter-like MFS transporter
LLSEIVPSNVRYTVVAFTFNVGFGLFGGTAPLLGLLLIAQTKNILSPGIYLSVTALVTLLVTISFIKTRKKHETRKIRNI